MTTQTLEPATTVAGKNLGGKYLTFALGDESYAVDVRKVRAAGAVWAALFPDAACRPVSAFGFRNSA